MPCPAESGAAAPTGTSDPETTEDAFLGGRLTVLQPASGARAGIDALFLAAAVPVRGSEAESVLEAGLGHGVAALALAARAPGARVTGVEIQPALARLARENARRNGMEARIAVIQADMMAPAARLARLGLAAGSFDHVMANPPFHEEGRSRRPADPSRTRAHTAAAGDLDRWIRTMHVLAAAKASITLIHRAPALPALLDVLERRFGGLIAYPLFPRAGAPASRVIVQGVKGSRAPFALAAGLVLHDRAGGFTPEAERVLREGGGLTLLA